VICDAHHLPFETGTFETVICIHVLEHCKCPYQVISEISRVGHIAIIKVPNIGIWDVRDPDHMYSWTKTSLRRLLEQHFKHVTIGLSSRVLFSPVLRKYPLLRRYFAVTDYLLTWIFLHFAKNEITATCFNY
jgi:ubiquinone/menaquinone biosynthesis C-methylase UbiE